MLRCPYCGALVQSSTTCGICGKNVRETPIKPPRRSRLQALKSRTILMGIFLGLAESAALLIGLPSMGGIPLPSGPPGLAGLIAWPIVSFSVAYRLSDLESTIKALLLSQIVNTLLVLSALLSMPALLIPLSKWDQVIPFFFSMTLPVYFLFALMSSLVGYVLAEWRKEDKNVQLPKSKWALEKFMRDRNERKSKRQN